MRILNNNNLNTISGGLTDKQVESLTAKAGGYAAKAAFLGLVAATTPFVSVPAFLIGGVAAPIASLVGTYVFYENQEYILRLLNDTQTTVSQGLKFA
jgi:hypothetical protein